MTAGIPERLRAAAAALQGERVSMAELLRAHGPAAQGSLLLLMAVPCLLPIPGTGTVLGLGVLAMAVTMWRGQFEPPLPGRVARLELSCAWARRLLGLLAWLYGLASRVSRARLSGLLAAPSQRATAACVGAMAVALVLPIPFGNVLPALTLVLIGTGLVFRDGAAVLSGQLMAIATLVLTTLLLLAAGDWVAGWLV
jgi:hypothetical protein